MISLPPPFSQYPRYPLLYTHPSPIEPLHHLTAELFPLPKQITKLWIKREDSNSGLGGGGNKIRKLEYVIPDAQAAGATVLVTTGGHQSNHMRQVASAGVRVGMKVQLIPRDAVLPIPSDAYMNMGNIQLTSLMSADRHPTSVSVDTLLDRLRASGENSCWIPSGASTHPLGGLGFARFAYEVATQEAELRVFFDSIFVACNSGSTLGGMMAGFRLLAQHHSTWATKARKLIGIDTSAGPEGQLAAQVLQIAHRTAKKIGVLSIDSTITKQDFIIDTRWNAGAYGVADDRTTQAIRLLASTEGVVTDPVYTGKALARLIEIARQGELASAENVLFVRTGGTSVLSTYPQVL